MMMMVDMAQETREANLCTLHPAGAQLLVLLHWGSRGLSE